MRCPPGVAPPSCYPVHFGAKVVDETVMNVTLAPDPAPEVPHGETMSPPEKTPSDLLHEACLASCALHEARKVLVKEKSADAAIAFCKAFMAAKRARAALPKLRIVERNDQDHQGVPPTA